MATGPRAMTALCGASPIPSKPRAPVVHSSFRRIRPSTADAAMPSHKVIHVLAVTSCRVPHATWTMLPAMCVLRGTLYPVPVATVVPMLPTTHAQAGAAFQDPRVCLHRPPHRCTHAQAGESCREPRVRFPMRRIPYIPVRTGARLWELGVLQGAVVVHPLLL